VTSLVNPEVARLIEGLLRSHRTRLRKMRMLRQKLAYRGSSLNSVVPKKRQSGYREHGPSIDITQALVELGMQKAIVDDLMSILDGKERMFVRLRYFMLNSWKEISGKTSTSIKSLQKVRRSMLYKAQNIIWVYESLSEQEIPPEEGSKKDPKSAHIFP
jgi:hypothetical protein